MSLTHHRIRRALAEKQKAQLEANSKELEEQETLQTPDFKKMNTTELKEYANSKNLDISGFTKKEDILNQILTVLNSEDSNVGDIPDGNTVPNEGASVNESNPGTT